MRVMTRDEVKANPGTSWILARNRFPTNLLQITHRMVRGAILIYERILVEKIFLVESQLEFPDYLDYVWAHGKLEFFVFSMPVTAQGRYFVPVSGYSGADPVHLFHAKVCTDIARHNPTDLILEYKNWEHPWIEMRKTIELISFMDSLHNGHLPHLPLIIKTAKARVRRILADPASLDIKNWEKVESLFADDGVK